MRLIFAALRTLLWWPFFYGGSLALVVVAALLSPFRPDSLFAITRAWARWHRLCARLLLGQRVVVEGELPAGPAFVVMKHEAMFETIDAPGLFNRPVVFAKQELFAIPLWGTLAMRYGLIPIEREAGARALREMRRAALAAIEAGRPIILFPEGTRVRHGTSPSIRSGFAGVYALLGQPVVPVAVDSGRLRAAGWIRLPGTIRYCVGATIPPGLPREEAQAQAHAAINALNRADPD